MTEPTTATCESSGVDASEASAGSGGESSESACVDVEAVDYLPAADGEPPRRPTTGGLATYYRLRCLALEARVAALEAELERQERHREELRARYEDILQNRDCRDDFAFSHLR